MHGALYGGLCSSAAMAVSELIKSSSVDMKNLSKEHLDKISSEENKVVENIFKNENYESFSETTKEKLNKDWKLFKVDKWNEKQNGDLQYENFIIKFEN